MRTWYDRTGRSKNAVTTQLCLSLYFFATFSRVVFTFAGDLVHFLVAVRSPNGRGWSPSGLTGVLMNKRMSNLFYVL